MPRVHRWVLVCGVALTTVSEAQTPARWVVGIAGGLAGQDRHGTEVRRIGVFQAVHVGRHLGSRWAIGAELSHFYAHQDDTALPLPCEREPCERRFTGPVQVFLFTLGAQARWQRHGTLLTASIGPSVHYLHQGALEGQGIRPGLNLGIGMVRRLAGRFWAGVVVHYHQLFTRDANPRWLLPVALQLELR